MANQRKRIFRALFDVRPVTSRGDLDIERVKKIKGVLDLRGATTQEEAKQRIKAIKVENEELLSREQILAELEQVETFDQLLKAKPIKAKPAEKISPEQKVALDQFYFPEVAFIQKPVVKEPFVKPSALSKEKVSLKRILGFLMLGFLIALAVPAVAWLNRGLQIKDDVLSSGLSAYQNLLTAQESVKEADWQTAQDSFSLARADFLKAQQEISQMGRLALNILENLPGASLVSSGSRLVRVGEGLSQAGQSLVSAIRIFSSSNLFSLFDWPANRSENILASRTGSLTETIAASQADLAKALAGIRLANQEFEQVKIESLPTGLQEKASLLKSKLPLAEEMLKEAQEYSSVLLKVLGHYNPRQYLLIFQNNSEMRATGGFIGTYGLLTLDRGNIKELFIDGVFNADGQLHEKIIPPRPIQKISTAWSMHDANWFADFPTSAQKIAWFYEKTGGPTVDGVISLTPTVIERLLQLTGPIAMPEYGVVLNSDNFVELVQYKVEVDYDKELNRPKKILADFAPKFIEALSQLSASQKKQALETILAALKEKHILIYLKDVSLEDWLIKEGWAGQLLETDRDYLSVVSSNINGYKTDRVVEESIVHQAEIQEDGSVIDTLTITRRHRGGQLNYDWWNRVNANYLRVYLPLGSRLISARGQTREQYQPPIDYQKEGFKEDPLVSSIEKEKVIDSKTGTQIFQENGKTVFANWLYLSPGETVVSTYQYQLPFKIDLTKPSDRYSLLAQKQAGSLGNRFSHRLKFPAGWQVSWRYPEDWSVGSGQWQGDLRTDRFLGAAFQF